MKKVVSFVAFTALFAVIGIFAFISAPLSSSSDAGAPVAIEANAPAASLLAVGKYNAIAMPLSNSGIGLASEMLAEVNSTTGVTATTVTRHDTTLGFVAYDPSDPFSSDFAITTGMPMFVQAQGAVADTLTFVGDVPAQASVNFSLAYNSGACTDNFISLPLDQGAITLASELLASVPNSMVARQFDADLGFLTYDPGDPFSSDFATNIGYPYFVCVTAASSWPN
jgi:hypothetical protein